MSNEYLDWRRDMDNDEEEAYKINKEIDMKDENYRPPRKTHNPNALDQSDSYLEDVVNNSLPKKPTGKDTCPDCKGGLNAEGKHLDCRTCNHTGIV